MPRRTRRNGRSSGACVRKPTKSTTHGASTSAAAAVANAVIGEQQRVVDADRSMEQESNGPWNSEIRSQLALFETDDDTSDDENYGNLHRLVMQGMMASGVLDGNGVKKLFLESLKHLKMEIPAEKDIMTYILKTIKEINVQLKLTDMAIKCTSCEITGKRFYLLVITMEVPILKLQCQFSKPEVDLFKRIMNSILRTKVDFLMSTVDCINFVADLNARGFTKENAQKFVDRLIEMKYLEKVYKEDDDDKRDEERDYYITLGFRTIREFEPVFQDRALYGQIFATCCLCRTIMLNGLQCPDCPAEIHRGCLRKYVNNSKNCPKCQGTWKDEDALPVRMNSSALQAGSLHRDSSAPSEPQPGTSKSQSRGTCSNGTSSEDTVNTCQETEVGESDSSESEVDESPPPSTRANKVSKKGNKGEGPKAAVTRTSKRKK